MKKKILSVIFALSTLGLLLGGCSNAKDSSSTADTTTTKAEAKSSEESSSTAEKTKLTIIADIVPHSELLEYVKPALAEQGVDLEIIQLSDDTALERTETGEVDANFFAHQPYLDSVSAELGYTDLVSAGSIHVEPIGAYSQKYNSVEEIPDNASVVIPNDTTNEYRALKILETAGFIKLKSDLVGYSATVNDIAEYVKPIKIQEIDADQIIRLAPDFDVYITNTNNILESGIEANTALFRENADSPYANIIIVKKENLEKLAIQKLVAALQTDDVKKFIEEKYKGAVIPAF